MDICIFNTIRVYTSQENSWAEQITFAQENFYRPLRSSKTSKTFENLFKFKILKCSLGVIFHYFPSAANTIL